MKKHTGIWIDHREAILVSVEGENTSVQHLQSGAESHFKPSGGWKSGGTSVAQAVGMEKSSEESRMHQYHAFYKKVIALLGGADTIWIFGPGEAKKELAAEIAKVHRPGGKVKAVEACDRMTEKQLVAKVRSRFEAEK